MRELEARKRLLVAECEVYRELLKLEIQNLKIHGVRTRKKFRSLRWLSPFVMMSLPMAGSLFRRKRRFAWRRVGALALIVWRFYRMFGRRTRKAKREPTAAEEFLEKRI